MQRHLSLILPILASTGFVGCKNLKSEKLNQRVIPEHYVEGSFVTELKSGENPADLTSVMSEIGGKYGCSSEAPQEVKWERAGNVLAEELKNTFQVRFKNCSLGKEQTNEILGKLLGTEQIVAAEADAIAQATAMNENDPMKDRQYYLDSIQRDKACELSGAKSTKPVIVAIIDSGVNTDHPDLKDQLLRDSSGDVIWCKLCGQGLVRRS